MFFQHFFFLKSVLVVVFCDHVVQKQVVHRIVFVCCDSAFFFLTCEKSVFWINVFKFVVAFFFVIKCIGDSDQFLALSFIGADFCIRLVSMFGDEIQQFQMPWGIVRNGIFIKHSKDVLVKFTGVNFFGFANQAASR